MKFIAGAIVVILAIGFAGFLLPSIVGLLIGIPMIRSGHVIGGLLFIAAGIGINAAMLYGSYLEGGSPHSPHSRRSPHGHIEEECPYCGSDDTDGNHCFSCDEEF